MAGKKLAPVCTRAPRWISYLSIAIIMVVLLVLVYQWFVQRRMQEAFQEQTPFRMIFVHMEGCGYCERFMPVWVEFTQKHAEELRLKGVSVEHYDRTAPEWQELGISDVNAFPTVLMIKRSDNSNVGTFAAERTATNLHKWALSTIG